MSTTSGPVLPESTGNSSDLPSGSLSCAVLSAMVFLSGGAQARHDILELRLIGFAAAGDDVPQIVVRQVEQRAHRMHSYRPSRCSRSCGDCSRSRSGGGSWLMT